MSATIRRLPEIEFIALIAMLFANVAFAIDAMLPALPEIAARLSPEMPNHAQLVLITFVGGMGVGTLFTGPLSDSFGRRRVIFIGTGLYALAAALCWASSGLEMMLAARFVQGLGAAGARIVSLAIVRDLYKGAAMARIVSFGMMIFTLIPAVAPMIGQWIIDGYGWRAIFLSFILFSAMTSLWLYARQPETLAPENRRPFRVAPLWAASKEVLRHRKVRLAIMAQTCAFAALFATLTSTQPIFDLTFGEGERFAMWFALIALCSGMSSFLNGMIVRRFGMRQITLTTFFVQMVISCVVGAGWLFAFWPQGIHFPVHLIWTMGAFFMIGLTAGNLNAIGMEPLGHIAGMGASIMGALSTLASVLIAAPIGLLFDGTPIPLVLSVAMLSALGGLITWRIT